MRENPLSYRILALLTREPPARTLLAARIRRFEPVTIEDPEGNCLGLWTANMAAMKP